MVNSCTTGKIYAGHKSVDVQQDCSPLPTLLGKNAQHVEDLQMLRDGGFVRKMIKVDKSVPSVPQKHSAVSDSIVSKPAATAKGDAQRPEGTITVESADSADQKKGKKQIREIITEKTIFVDAKHKLNGARVEYYSKSYGEWIPAIIGDVRPNGCLKLFHDDGSVLKSEADPDSVRLPTKQANQSCDTLDNNTRCSGRAWEMCSRPAIGTEQANSKQSFSEDYDQQMNYLHGLSQKLNAQLKVHRGLSEGMVQDQQLELTHLEFRHNLGKALGLDVTNLTQSDEQRAAQHREEWLKMLNV
eukprot:gnl/MRDRNA2_/MRDRNA2_94701_c0_seq1.p1 gnl/MRDRNA2_/MRDRNA2_94701_c0~~gnl/MRDRNA2_/MRDRNA2_94701_c0_seq1.p1  ORF type:complete len:300 (+),score=64.79 gnl/MRDRNA2_/MRDRNA2_94701_c0_seq1:85-984(+)